MRNWLPFIVAVSCWWTMAANSARAQLVQVYSGGGTYVRAPFVRVQVDPWGRTHVRAPFTSVYSPGYYRPARIRGFRQRRFVQAKEIRDMEYRELREALRVRLTKLESQLRTRQDGAEWSRYLQPGATRDLVAGQANHPADELTTQQLQTILEEYDGTAADPTSQSVANLSGFREVHAALAEFLRPPTERQRYQLFEDALALSHALSQFKTGDGWQRYLLLTDPSVSESATIASEWSDAEIRQLLDRFESVSGNPEFEVISRLQSFQATHRSLASYVRYLNSREEEAESLPPAEELPLP